MNKLTIISLFSIVVSCSAPRYTYNFDHYSVRPETSAGIKDINNISENRLTSSLYDTSSSFSEYEKTLTASSSKGITFLRGKMLVNKVKVSKDTLPEIKSEKKVEGTPGWKVIENSKAGDKKKNRYAVLGLTSSSLGWVLVLFAPGAAAFLFLIGLILSAMGFKSQRKALAIIGFVLGIIPILYFFLGLFWFLTHPGTK